VNPHRTVKKNNICWEQNAFYTLTSMVCHYIIIIIIIIGLLTNEANCTCEKHLFCSSAAALRIQGHVQSGLVAKNNPTTRYLQ
jgi:hypothetical protein